MTNAMRTDTLNTAQNGHLINLAMYSDRMESYALTLRSARCFFMAVLAGGSECFSSGMTLFNKAVVRCVEKVEHFYYVPHPKDFLVKNFTSILKNGSQMPNGISRVGSRIGLPNNMPYGVYCQTLPNLTNQIDGGYASSAHSHRFTNPYQIIDTLIQMVRSLPIFTKLNQLTLCGSVL